MRFPALIITAIVVGLGLGLGTGAAVAGAASAGPVFIPLGDANKIARVSADGSSVESFIEGVDNTHGLAVTPDGRYLYAGSLLEQVAGADDAAERPAGVSEAEHEAHHGGMAAKPDAAPKSFSFITQLDATSGEIVRRIDVEKFTHHVTVSPDGRTVIGVQSGAGRIVVIDANQGLVARYVPVGAAPNYALVTRDGGRVFVSSAGTNAVTVLETGTWRKVAAVAVGEAPEHMAFSPDERRLYVVNVGSGELSIVDTDTLQEVARVKTGTEPHGVAFNAPSGTVVVSNKGDDSLSVFDPKGALLQLVPLGPEPYHVANGPDGSRLWVTSRKQGTVWLLSTSDFTVAGTIEIPGIGHQIAMAR